MTRKSLLPVLLTAGYNVRDLGLLSPNANGTRVALVGMRVARNQRVRADASGFAGIVNLLEHRRTATMTTLAEGWMMDADDKALASTRFTRRDDGFQSADKPCDLLLIAAGAFQVARTLLE